MEVLSNVLQICESIYSLCEKASSNKKQCVRLQKSVKMLLLTAEELKKQPGKSEGLSEVLGEMKQTLSNAECWVNKYSHRAWWRKVVQANGIKEEFDLINDRLTDAVRDISVLLVAEQRAKILCFIEEQERKKQEKNKKRDIEDDMAELMESMKSMFDKVDNIVERLEDGSEEVLRAAELFKGIRTTWDIKEIPATDLTREELVMERPGHCLYRGEYHKGPVAIKVLKGQLVKNNDYVRKTFQSESETMRRFECVNILRLYGICIDNSHGEPSYSLVMEFCEKGTLRELLSRELDLSWKQRVHMVLDAARAVYRLHHSELKAILHGSLSSSKFLVDGTYYLKLSGFELSKTESSMRRPSNAEKRQESIGWAYMAPETLTNINAYNKCSEVYSLGVVCYEIASGNVPLDGLRIPEGDLGEIHQRLRAEVDAGIPIDCPKILRDIITQSLETDPSNRPTAGGIVDRLIAHLNQPEPSETPMETSV
ncbi:mixed lineage kinase domain-like protein [Pelodytes ibericus]